MSGEEAEDVLLDLCAQIITALCSSSHAVVLEAVLISFIIPADKLVVTAGRASCIGLTLTAASGRSAAWGRRGC